MIVVQDRKSVPVQSCLNPFLYFSQVIADHGVDRVAHTKEAGTPHFEPQGWVHRWANEGDAPLVLRQANISEEGTPAVIMTELPPAAPAR